MVLQATANLCAPGREAVFREGRLSPAFYVGFPHISQCMDHASTGPMPHPGDFQFVRYRQALNRVVDDRCTLLRTWFPGSGDFLGPFHLRYAQSKLEARFEELSQNGDPRLGALLWWARHATSRADVGGLFAGLPDHLQNVHWLEQAADFVQPAPGDVVSSTRLRHVRRLLGLTAKVCRYAARVPGCLARFKTDVLGTGPDSEASLSLLLQLGGDLLAFYLMLWEHLIFTTTMGGLHE